MRGTTTSNTTAVSLPALSRRALRTTGAVQSQKPTRSSPQVPNKRATGLTVPLIMRYLKATSIEKLLPNVPNKKRKSNLVAFLSAISEQHGPGVTLEDAARAAAAQMEPVSEENEEKKEEDESEQEQESESDDQSDSESDSECEDNFNEQEISDIGIVVAQKQGGREEDSVELSNVQMGVEVERTDVSGGSQVHASAVDSESPQPIQSRPKRVRKQFNVYSAGLDEFEVVMVNGVACKKKRCK